ncbi:hypothetical protein [Okeania sp. SIO2B3]|uniref:hypothetical protein n=1 Tax=Okeania sp. SIO2B3 TaxID=2607784 RepID=UPI0025F763AA|nr:hypothetical protein [Okeania sp. SIO2B3]
MLRKRFFIPLLGGGGARGGLPVACCLLPVACAQRYIGQKLKEEILTMTSKFKLLQNIWRVLNTEIELNLLESETVKGGVEGGKAVFEIAEVIQENATELSLLNPFINNIDSLLDALNSPLGQVVKEGLPFLPIATGIITYIIKKTGHEPTLEDEVELVAQAAYLESLREFLIDHPEISEKLETEASEAVQKKIKKWDEEIDFNDRKAKDTLICFYDSPLREKFDDILFARLKESGLDDNMAENVTERISRSTHRYLKEAVLEVKDDAKKLAGIYGGGWQQDLEVYSSIDKYLEEAIAEKPKEKVFDENFSFQDIYVPLKVKPVDSDGKVKETATPQNIEEWAKAILLDEKKNKQVLFIQAGPGRGKSVFCRMFADFVRRELHPIYYIRRF